MCHTGARCAQLPAAAIRHAPHHTRCAGISSWGVTGSSSSSSSSWKGIAGRVCGPDPGRPRPASRRGIPVSTWVSTCVSAERAVCGCCHSSMCDGRRALTAAFCFLRPCVVGPGVLVGWSQPSAQQVGCAQPVAVHALLCVSWATPWRVSAAGVPAGVLQGCRRSCEVHTACGCQQHGSPNALRPLLART
jgi:hypothetical protein